MNATDGRPTIGHHPRASRLHSEADTFEAHGRTIEAGMLREMAAEVDAANARVSSEELLQMLSDNRDARGAVSRMLGWSHLLPEDAIIGLRAAKTLIDCVEEGVMNAIKAQRGC
jgi:hypothetical protein